MTKFSSARQFKNYIEPQDQSRDSLIFMINW